MKRVILVSLVFISNLVLAQQSVNKEFQTPSISSSYSLLDPKLLLAPNNSYFLDYANNIIHLDSNFNVTWAKSVVQNSQNNVFFRNGKVCQMVGSNFTYWGAKYNNSGAPWIFDTLIHSTFNNTGNLLSQRVYTHSSFINDPFQVLIIDVKPTNDSGAVLLFRGRDLGLVNKYSLVKYNKQGVKQWLNQFSIGQTMKPLILDIADDQSIYITASHLIFLGNRIDVLKFKANGNLNWQKRISNGKDYLSSSGLVNDGLIISYSRSQNNVAINGLVKLDTSGNIVLQKQINQTFKVLKPLPNNCMIGATINNSIVKFDSVFNVEWLTKLPIDVTDIVYRRPFPYIVLGKSAGSNVSIISIDSIGYTSSCSGPDNITISNDSIQFINSNVNVTYYNSFINDVVTNSVTFSNLSVPSNAGCIPTSVNTLNNKEHSNIVCYPNPSNGLIEITNNEGVGFNIEIFEALGHQVYFKENNAAKCQLDLRALSKGLYFYKIKTQSGSQNTNKLMID